VELSTVLFPSEVFCAEELRFCDESAKIDGIDSRMDGDPSVTTGVVLVNDEFAGGLVV